MAKQQNQHTKLLNQVISEAVASGTERSLEVEGITTLLGTDPYASVMAKVPGQFRDGKAAKGQKRDLMSVAEVVANNPNFSPNIKGIIAQAARRELNRNRTGRNPDENGTDQERATKAIRRAAGRGAIGSASDLPTRQKRGKVLVSTVQTQVAMRRQGRQSRP